MACCCGGGVGSCPACFGNTVIPSFLNVVADATVVYGPFFRSGAIVREQRTLYFSRSLQIARTFSEQNIPVGCFKYSGVADYTCTPLATPYNVDDRDSVEVSIAFNFSPSACTFWGFAGWGFLPSGTCSTSGTVSGNPENLNPVSTGCSGRSSNSPNNFSFPISSYLAPPAEITEAQLFTSLPTFSWSWTNSAFPFAFHPVSANLSLTVVGSQP